LREEGSCNAQAAEKDKNKEKSSARSCGFHVEPKWRQTARERSTLPNVQDREGSLECISREGICMFLQMSRSLEGHSGPG
jgi:hypothetical protein